MNSKTLIGIVACLVGASVAWGQQQTLQVPLTPEHQAGLQYFVAKVNEERAQQSPPLPQLTAMAYGQQQCQSLFSNYAQQKVLDEEDQAGVGRGTLRGLSEADRQKLKDYVEQCRKAGCR